MQNRTQIYRYVGGCVKLTSLVTEALRILSPPSKRLLGKTSLLRFAFAKDRLNLLHFMQFF